MIPELIKKTKYMEFWLIEKKPKTNKYEVYNKKSGDVLGWISWYSVWRQYVYEMEYQTVYSHDCLRVIADFLTELNKNHKEKYNKGI